MVRVGPMEISAISDGWNADFGPISRAMACPHLALPSACASPTRSSSSSSPAQWPAT
jgi:hypothetical protein